MESFDFINRDNVDYIESLYQQYLKDPRSLDDKWVSFFTGYNLGHEQTAVSIQSGGDGESAESPREMIKGIYALVHYYREIGHLVAKLDPLGHNRIRHPLLELSEFGLSTQDLDRQVGTGGFRSPTNGTLQDLIAKLRITYCGTSGIEYTHIADKNQTNWLQEKIEPILNQPVYSAAQCRQNLSLLISADEFEKFLHTKYIGKKRFSMEGADSLLLLLHTLVETGASLGTDEIVMGMAHRGRLNVLAHLLRKPYELILSEFEGTSIHQDSEGDGDVKYHLGYSCDHLSMQGHKIHISLSSNPSHLELINPVIEGIIRAKQEYRNDRYYKRVVPILVHGEASFTGQGIVSETLSLSQLEGYKTGGTIHIIINNQLGYTATPNETRFTPYPTDVTKIINAPIFHVNGDDPEASVYAAQLAMEFREKFNADVMIDLVCYRRYGHNEADDPTFTQPLMYEEIVKHLPVSELYARQLTEQNKIAKDEVLDIRKKVRQRLESALQFARELRPRQHISTLEGRWNGITHPNNNWNAETAINLDVLRKIGEKATRVPPNFSIQPKLKRILASRMQMIQGEIPCDWGCAEMLAFGSLLLEGTPVRLVGQDSQRGTFSHRHAVWHEIETGEQYVPLSHIDDHQASFTVLNSMLSESAVLGFEYGISLADPYRLVIWEAQFGDFINGAQAVIDELISSAESKWQRRSGIVLMLPHGYEGQGPDHSSARMERFLQLCAEKNMQVCYPTTPAQYFHVLRRQMHRKFRKPLILFTPKSLLRHKLSTSRIEDFTRDRFHSVITDTEPVSNDPVKSLVFCTGKIYFELLAEQEKQHIHDAVLIRVEQLYPFPQEEIEALLRKYKQVKEVRWVQEEPHNMGAWFFIEPRLRPLLPDSCVLSFIGRSEAASPATGLYQVHMMEQEKIIQGAFETADARR